MLIGRRGLLSVGVAVGTSVTASACSASQGPGADDQRRATAAASPVRQQPMRTAQPAGPAALFASSTPAGHLYYGASLPPQRSLPRWESELGERLTVHRSYFTPERNEISQLVARCRDDLVRGRLPHVSMKPVGTWEETATGEWDDWLRQMLVPLSRLDGPVIFTLHHEPENDAVGVGMRPVDFLTMQRRLIEMAARLAPNVVIAPILQHWTFDPLRPNVNPDVWIVPEAEVMGLDLYNPWSPTNAKAWRTFASKCEEVRIWVPDAPLVIGEYGCRVDPDNPGLASSWMRDAVEYARSHNIVSMSYFNSHLNSVDGTWELTGETERAFAGLLTSPWVARPT